MTQRIFRLFVMSAFLMASSEGYAVATNPMPGWVNYCKTSPADCTTNLKEPDVVTLTQDVVQKVVRINQEVNRMFIPIAEPAGVDVWRIPSPGDQADCEDFQLTKRKLLVAEGIPHRAMRMTVVLNEYGEGHAVLMLRTDRGDVILDNRTDDILEMRELRKYTFLKREGSNGGWEFIPGGNS